MRGTHTKESTSTDDSSTVLSCSSYIHARMHALCAPAAALLEVQRFINDQMRHLFQDGNILT